MKPKVLLATTCRWFATTRLAMGLKSAGFDVEVVCPSGHAASVVSAVQRIYPYHALFALPSFRAAISKARPDLVIPCDDLATAHLHSIYRLVQRGHRRGKWIAALVERSLGDPAGFAIVGARSTLVALAESEGVRVPRTTLLENPGQLDLWIAEHGLPAVLKTDGTSGGVGVKVVTTLDEARRAFTGLNAPPIAARVAKRAIVDRDINLLLPFLLRQRPLINVQGFIRGCDATGAVACWQGKVLASILFEVVHTWKPKGPASVVRILENNEMSRAAEKIVGKLRLSGLYGFDFMVEEDSGDVFLIEMNPRATQTCHLSLGTGHDLPTALWSIFSERPLEETKRITEKKEIALFPQEWQRNPASHFLSTAYHDVPWEEPELMHACLQGRILGGARSSDSLMQAYAKMPWRH